MKNLFLANQVSIYNQMEKTELLTEQRAALLATPLRETFKQFSRAETPDEVIKYIRGTARASDVSFQSTITKNAFEKVQIVVGLVQAQRALAAKSFNPEIERCIKEDTFHLEALFEKAAKSLGKTKEIREVTDVLSHSILPLFQEVYGNVVRMNDPELPEDLQKLGEGQLVEEIAARRLQFVEHVLNANGHHLARIETTLAHVGYLERAKVSQDKDHRPALEKQIEVRLDYAEAALDKSLDRLRAAKSYSEDIYDMAAGDGGPFLPVKYVFAPVGSFF